MTRRQRRGRREREAGKRHRRALVWQIGGVHPNGVETPAGGADPEPLKLGRKKLASHLRRLLIGGG
jgi:hypothetical protein